MAADPHLTSLREQAADLDVHLRGLRRKLRRGAEVGLCLPATQRTVVEELSALGLDPVRGQALSSVIAIVRGDEPGPAVLLRADMDALPLTEPDAPDRAVHACGHDLHTAALLGAARLLAGARRLIRGSVVLMFQPGEELLQGARLMIDEGVLTAAGSEPVAAYALHVEPELPRGHFVTRPGPIMAAFAQLTVTYAGAGGHGARPHETTDPVSALGALIGGLHTYVARRVDALDAVVISVGQVSAGSAPNVIPASARLAAGVRTFSGPVWQRLAADLPDLARAIGRAHGARTMVELTELCPVTANDPAEVARARRTVENLFGADRFSLLDRPRTGSEDFAEILNAVPGAYLFVGARRDGTIGPVAGNHSPRVRFDDRMLPDAAAMLAGLAINRLRDTAPRTD